MDGRMDGESPGERVQRNKPGCAKLAAEPLPCSSLPPCPEANVFAPNAIGLGQGMLKALALP